MQNVAELFVRRGNETVKNYKPFLRREFTPEYEEMIRSHFRANDIAKMKQPIERDRLILVWGWTHSNTGFVLQARWANGVTDGTAMADVPEAVGQQKLNANNFINQFFSGKDYFEREVVNG